MKQEENVPFWRLLYAAVDSLRELGSVGGEKYFASMTFNQMRMIKIVYTLNREFPEGVTLKILAESLSITPAAASEMVDALVRKGFLKRDHNPQDRRAVAITLSNLVKRKFNEYESAFGRISGEFLDSLSAEEREEYIATTAKFALYLKQRQSN